MRTVLISPYSYNSCGIKCLYSFLKKELFDVNLIFFKEPLHNNVDFPSEKEIGLLLNEIERLNPDIIGLSILSPFFEIVKEISRKIKQRFPDSLLLMGGHHAIICPEECIEVADLVCVGEGEKMIPELINRLSQNKSIDAIEGLWVKKENGVVIKNGTKRIVRDLDSLPLLDYEDEGMCYIHDNKLKRGSPLKQYSGAIGVLTRGCPFKCSFCTNPILQELFEGYSRKMSVGRAIRELEHMKNNLKNLNFITFEDEIFPIADKEWLTKFVKEYKEKINLPFRCNLHPSMVDDERVALLKSAGLDSCFLSIESGSEKIRTDVYNRFISNEQVLNVSTILKKYGIICYYELILDNPYDTEDSLRETFELCLKLPRPFNFQIFSLNCFPKTLITKRMLKEGIIKDWDRMKSLKRWRFTLDKSNFWYALIILTSKSFVPKNLIMFFSNSVFFKRHPVLITSFCKSVSSMKLFFRGIKLLFTGMSYAQIRRCFKKFKVMIQ